MQIKNIIFDLGGVLLNINYHATIKAYKEAGVTNFDKFFTQAKQNHLFDRLDKGEVSPQGFRAEMRSISGLNLSDELIDQAWNAMLLDLPSHRIPLLEEAKKHYRTFLLSNTNAIHYPAYTAYLKEAHGYESLSLLFEKQYLSHEIGMRKPDVETFLFVLEQNGLKAEETLFFDDTLQHVEGARKAGLHAYWIDLEKEAVEDYFENGKLKDSFFTKLESQLQRSHQ